MASNFTRATRSILLAATLLAAAAPADAHHSFASFDVTTQKTITGTVKRIDWTNPHIWIWVDVPGEAGGTETYGFEGMSPNYLARRGWQRTTLSPGDTITITFRPLRDGMNGGMFMRATRPDGVALTMGGAEPAP